MANLVETTPFHYAKTICDQIKHSSWDAFHRQDLTATLNDFFDVYHDANKENDCFTDEDDLNGWQFELPEGEDLVEARRLFLGMAPDFVSEAVENA